MDSSQIEAPLMDTAPIGHPPSTSEGFVRRWIIVVVFLLAGAANAMTLLTFSPVFDQAVTYFTGPLNGSGSGTSTAVNLLFSAFQIMFLPGTLAGVYVQKNYGLRCTLLYAGSLTTVGMALRWVAAELYEDNSPVTYVIILIGTMLVAQAQPVYLNLPTMISLTWFPVAERDFAMTILSLANTAGSAAGSVVPALVVKSSATTMDDLQPAFRNLLLVQLVTAGATFVLVYVLFLNAPKVPPSVAAEKLAAIADAAAAAVSKSDGDSVVIDSSDTGAGAGAGIIGGPPSSTEAASIYEEVCTLMTNAQYMRIFFGFASAIASLNSLASLLGQLPLDNTAAEIGFVGFSIILTGFVGAVACGVVLAKYKAYATTLKASYTGAMVFWIAFALSAHHDALQYQLVFGALLGFFVLAGVPAGLQNAVESAYPVSEDISVGLMYLAANLLTIPYTFIGQSLLNGANEGDNNDSPHYTTFGYFSTAMLGMGWLCVMTYKSGEYRRLNLENEGGEGAQSQEVDRRHSFRSIDGGDVF